MKNKDIFTFRDAEKQAGPVAFSTMLKPAGSACNLDCHYCYYLDKAVQYGGRQAVMSDELLELYVKQYIEANEVPTVQFCWHGGEPLLLALESVGFLGEVAVCVGGLFHDEREGRGLVGLGGQGAADLLEAELGGLRVDAGLVE